MKSSDPEIIIVERPEMKAIVLRTIANKRDVRLAWKEIEAAMADHSGRPNADEGLVFIPEWQWATRVETLWVGVQVNSLERVPEGLETITIPAKKYAKLQCAVTIAKWIVLTRHCGNGSKAGGWKEI
ncbi:GyrI-like domain-containing protein [Paenibacillus sp. DMB20]|uniref:GyrI-like domain-containing protein n=1 Tax=Paenibacillus sp. DMB20 TaxID=1642570 RepID=UPI00069AFC4B|nr:GyrI-like domain-containing protein [Paenibacillus sp. DMB20]